MENHSGFIFILYEPTLFKPHQPIELSHHFLNRQKKENAIMKVVPPLHRSAVRCNP